MQFRPQQIPEKSDLFTDIHIPATTFTLENGLTVIVSENHDVPLVSLQLIYQVGSKDEGQGKTGFAHLFEHLMFEGSENAPGSFLDNMMRAGATNLNAFTSTDHTTYHATVPVGSLDYALFMESDRMGHFYNTINQASLDQQRRVVLNEKMETESGPYGKLYECKSKGCFPADHPYAHTVIGEKKDVETATLENVQNWFRMWYTPSNTVLALCGDIDIASAREKVTHWFGDIPPGPPVARPVAWVADIPQNRRDSYQVKVPNGSLMLVWNIPPYGDTDCTLLSLVADYFASGISSLLVKKLVYEDKIASNVVAYMAPATFCSQFIISATVVDGMTLPQLENQLLREIHTFLAVECDAELLQQVKNDVLNNFIESYKTSAQIAALLSNSHVSLGTANGYQQVLSVIRQASTQDIRQAAQRWLSRSHYTLELKPFIARRDENAVAADRHLPPQILPPVLVALPPAQHAQLDNGIKLVFLERHSHKDIYLDLLLPKTALPRPGQHQLLLELLNQSGAGNRDAFEFHNACRKIGCSIQMRKRLRHLSVLLSCRIAHFPDALSLLSERLQHSVLSEEDFLRQRALLQDALIEQQNMGSVQVLRVLPGLIYPAGHPSQVPEGIEGTALSLAQTELIELTHALPDLLNINGATLVVTGDTTLKQLLSLLNQSIGNITVRPRHRPNPVPVIAPTRPHVFLLHIPGADQTSIVTASLLPGIRETEEASFELLNTVFANGFTSRINLNLREDKNWTYGVKGQLINDPDHRVHYIQTEVQADRTCDAIQEILAEYQAINGLRPVTEKELEDARTTNLLSFSGSMESLAGLNNMVSWQIRCQLSDDFWHHHQQRISQITVEQVNELARRLFSTNQLTWVIAGDTTLFAQQLSELFPGSIQMITDTGDSLYD
ncbi:M16 family metallopeptidase [Brenneria uluponensis]|uniref:M16 family metallopeptidase n=1 Tax=Brenneria uluponensis TaxID=3057057 RepID=UPI0028EDFB40|nr:pitrilysin family protein [Brenneria ulupoensis]